jgi:hypothetical protein
MFDKTGSVSGIVDWEWSRQNACAGFDAVHLAAWAASDYYKRDLSNVLVALAETRDVPPPVWQFLENIFPSLDLAMEDLPHLAKLVWLHVLFRSGVWTEPPTDEWMNQFADGMLAMVRASR